MELSCLCIASRIWLTQVLHPRANCRKGLRHCTSCDRLVFATMASVADSTDKEAAESKFRIAQELTEGVGDGLLMTEFDPVAEGGGL